MNRLTMMMMAQTLGTIPVCPPEILAAEEHCGAYVTFPLPSPVFSELPGFPPGANPFHHDLMSMGTHISSRTDGQGRSLTAMYQNNAGCSMYLYDVASGRRWQVKFAEQLWIETAGEFESMFRRIYGMPSESYQEMQQ